MVTINDESLQKPIATNATPKLNDELAIMQNEEGGSAEKLNSAFQQLANQTSVIEDSNYNS